MLYNWIVIIGALMSILLECSGTLNVPGFIIFIPPMTNLKFSSILFWRQGSAFPVIPSSSLTCANLTGRYINSIRTVRGRRCSGVTAADLPLTFRPVTAVETWLWAVWKRLKYGSSRRSWESSWCFSGSSPPGDRPCPTRSCRPSATRCCSCQRRSSLRRSGEKRCVLGQTNSH